MKFPYLSFGTACILSFFSMTLGAQAPQEPDWSELAEQEADRLQTLLGLEDWQTFYVDSTLKYNYPAMDLELKELQRAKVANSSVYVTVQDKWLEKIDSSYMKIFTDQQWKAYLKSGAAKAIKAREKRKAKAAGNR